MSYLLKILKGANAGAEIALAEGAVTFGSGDACDIVLADATLAAESFVIETSGNGPTLRMLPDGETKALELYTIFTAGEMEFVVGEDGVPWGTLNRPKPPEPDAAPEPQEGESEEPAPLAAAEPPLPDALPEEKPEERPEKKEDEGRGFPVVRTLVVIVVLLLLALVGWWLWLHRENWNWMKKTEAEPVVSSAVSFSRIVAEAGLELAEADGRKVLRGNFVRRRDRMAVAAQVRAVDHEVRLDLSDDETLKLAAEEILDMATGGRVRVAVATNRCLRLEGNARTRDELLQTVAALCADVNRLRYVDDTAVVCADGHAAGKPTVYQRVRETAANPFVAAPTPSGPAPSGPAPSGPALAAAPKCPVAGLILTPYPCLVMRDGSRATVGAEIGGWTVEDISDREVTLRQGERTFRWKP